jgi:hypothetical protein
MAFLVWQTLSQVETQVYAGSHPVVVSTRMGTTEFCIGLMNWQNKHHMKVVDGQKVWLPTLDIYSPSGTLLYHGFHTDVNHTREVLESLRKRKEAIPNAGQYMSLPEVLDSTPELANFKNSMLEDHHFVVVSTAYFNAHDHASESRIQEDAVNAFQKQTPPDVDFVHIYVVRPSE